MKAEENLKRLVKLFWHLFLFAADHLVLVVPPCRSHKSREVLIIKPDKLGDFVVWLDAAREYRRCFPGCRLVLLADHSWAELAGHINWWDEVLPINYKQFGESLFYRIKILSNIRRRGFSTVVAVSRSFRYVDVIVRFSSAHARIGPDGNEALNCRGKELDFSDRWFTQVVRNTPRRFTTALRMNLKFVEALCGAFRRPALPYLEESTFAQFNNGHKIPSSYVVLVPGAGFDGRRWPVKNFIKMAELIVRHYFLNIVICGVESERGLAEAFSYSLSSSVHKHLVDLVGKTNLRQLTSLLRDAVVVISNDTGTMHLAAAVGTPVICIAGVGDFGHLVPYPEDIETDGRPLPITIYRMMPCSGCGWRCIHKVAEGFPFPCVAAVNVDEVWVAFDKLVAEMIRLGRIRNTEIRA